MQSFKTFKRCDDLLPNGECKSKDARSHRKPEALFFVVSEKNGDARAMLHLIHSDVSNLMFSCIPGQKWNFLKWSTLKI